MAAEMKRAFDDFVALRAARIEEAWIAELTSDRTLHAVRSDSCAGSGGV
jgi:hypothetical protein